MNESPSLQDEKRRAPLQLFAKTEVNANPKHWKTFGSPTFVLKEPLQRAGATFHKWKDRSKAGTCLGRSPQHSRNVALVLDRTSGLVSPQFHVVFNPTFGTVRDENFKCTWQMQAGFASRELRIEKPQKQGNKQQNANKQQVEKAPRSKFKGRRLVKKRTQQTNREPKQHAPQRAHAEGEVEQLQHSAANAENDTPQNPTEDPAGQDAIQKQVGMTPVHQHERQPGKRRLKPVQRLIQALAAEITEATADKEVPGEIMCLSAIAPCAGDREQNPLLAYKATSDPDAMCMHEAMREPDKDKFKQAMEKEWKDQIENGNFKVIPRNKVPEGAAILPAVWQMKRKRDIRTREIKKHKARLNIDGSRMRQGMHCDQTCSPVASWNSIRTLLTLAALHGWKTQQIDHALAFPQAPVERNIHVNMPRGFETSEGNAKDHVLQLNVHGQKQASRVWYEFLAKKLIDEVGFKQSAVDECVFCKGNAMHVLCTDDSMLAGPSQKEIDKAIQQTKDAKLNITIEGTLEDFLGVNISRKDDGTMHLTQPHLIDQILGDLGMKDENVKVKTVPASSSKLLSRHSDSKDFDNSFHYRSIIGKLNYLEKATRPDIAYSTSHINALDSLLVRRKSMVTQFAGWRDI